MKEKALKAVNEIINTLKEANNEATDSPWWVIIDPTQMMRPDVYHVATMITGPFFSRDDAEQLLRNRKHTFSKRARVFCMSGYGSEKYKKFYREITGIIPNNDINEILENAKQWNK